MLIKVSLLYNLKQREISWKGDDTMEIRAWKTHNTCKKVQKKVQRTIEKLRKLPTDGSQQQQCHISCSVFVHPRERTTTWEWNGCLSFFLQSTSSTLQWQNNELQSQRARRLKPSSRWGKRLEAQVLVWLWRATRLSYFSRFYKSSFIYTTLCG